MKAATPPWACTCAIACSVRVVFPLLSGPKISTTRPRGRPPTPSARSSPMEPVGITATGCASSAAPSLITEPRPNCFSIATMAAATAFSFSVSLLI